MSSFVELNAAKPVQHTVYTKHGMVSLPISVTNANASAPANLTVIFNEVRTERLALRRLRVEDRTAMFAIHSDPKTNQHNPYGPDPDIATSAARLQQWVQSWEDTGYGYWAVTLIQSEDIIGFGGIRHMIWCNRNVLNLYYRFTPSAWGHGYATEMAQMAVALARKHLPHLPIIARTRAGNIASIRTATRAGLERHPDLDTEHIILALGWDTL